MRVLMPAVMAGVVLLSSCSPSTDFDPDDPAVVAVIDSLTQVLIVGTRNADADRVMSVAEGAGELTFITSDVMLGGQETIGATFHDTYDGVDSQTLDVLEQRVRLLSPDVAILIATSEGTYTDKAGWTSDTVGMGHTLVFVREDGAWRLRHAHQSIAH